MNDDGQVNLHTICEVVGVRGGWGAVGRVESDHDSMRQAMTRQTASSRSEGI